MYPAAPRKGRAERSFQPRVITFIRVIPVLERGVRLRLGGPANQVIQHTVLRVIRVLQFSLAALFLHQLPARPQALVAHAPPDLSSVRCLDKEVALHASDQQIRSLRVGAPRQLEHLVCVRLAANQAVTQRATRVLRVCRRNETRGYRAMRAAEIRFMTIKGL